MANRFNMRDVKQAISIANTTFGQLLTSDDGSGFEIYPADAIGPVLPSRTPVPNNAVGDGKAYQKQSKPYYYNPANFPIAMALNNTIGHRLYRNWLGGTIANTANVPNATTDQVIQMKNPGTNPLVVNILRNLGGERFLHGDVWPQTIEMSQSGAGEPRMSFGMMNNGLFKELDDTDIDLANIDPMVDYLRYHGAKTSLTFSDGVDTYDFAADGRLIDVGFTGSQNVAVDQLPGDDFIDADNQCEGAYGKNANIDVQSAEMRVKVFMDDNFSDFASWKANRRLTSVVLVFRSCEKLGAGAYYSETEVKFPVGEFNLSGDTQGNNSAYSFSITAIEGDPVTDSLVIGRVRRLTAGGLLT